jgi:hypothetical protein
MNQPQEADTFDVTRFTVSQGRLTAVGMFTGTVTDPAGRVVEGSRKIALPVTEGLALGAVNLDLLGDLLDAVASLDDPTRINAVLQQIANRLNQRLRALA